jgi:putative PEP-CTERM system histidine kinase
VLADMPTMSLLHAGCAAIYAALIGLILLRARLSRTGLALSAACAVTMAWAVAVAVNPSHPVSGAAAWLELGRSVAWYGFVLHLYRRMVSRDRQVGQVVATAGLAAALMLGAAPLADFLTGHPGSNLWTMQVVARLGLAICNILLIENLYFNTPAEARWHVNLPCIALGGLFLYDLVLYSDALLFRRISTLLFEGRASVTAMVAPLLAVAAARNRTWKIDIHVSRSVVFHSASLIVSGVFLLALAAAGEVFRNSGAEWGMVAETSIIFGGLITIAVLLTSGSARSRLRMLFVEHFFSARYDYRREWVRCIETLAAPASNVAMQTRAIRAVAGVVDSPAGILFVRDGRGTGFLWGGSWNLAAAAVPVALEDPLLAAFRDGVWIVQLDQLETVPDWLGAWSGLWLAVPLPHAGRVIGFVLVARSRAGFRLEREAYDLLRVVGREVAIHVAEQRAQQVLSQTRDLREYSKRFAFVIHDIKNVSSQLSMLLSNAEVHGDNPEFQRDMLTTVRASVSKITALLSRLEARPVTEERTAIAPADRLRELAASCARAHAVEIEVHDDGQVASVLMEATAFDAVVVHLLDNAIEASPGSGTVSVVLRHEPLSVTVDVVDRGHGMSAEFIRDTLFVPFASTKRGGHGIGAFQARELLRECGGDLLALSRPGLGTTMRLLLPAMVGSAEKTVSRATVQAA